MINLLSTVVYAVDFWHVMKQRINLKFSYKLAKSAAESPAMLRHVYGDNTVTLKTVYWEAFKRLLARIRRVRSHRKEPGSWFLFYDNARPHTATLVKLFLATHGVTELSQPQYSPDLSPPDFFLFPKLKVALKGKFTDIMCIQAAVTSELIAIMVEEFSRAFDDLYTRSQMCILYDGDYFEGL
ncbi:hypothetical protein AVEN_211583-1 [Araneus ventricosus]|uniref:Histone-lysine N-methyltransferase SETMAR n=1 Tax=Araneus ventricosus TaxID=182803 RepID=A0A4Y2D8J6_ARAVE|nr:hypothetical protein AVEN_211583-1 [Araneus ventricosus]